MEKRKFKIGEIKGLALDSLRGKWVKILPIWLLYFVIAVVVPWFLSDYLTGMFGDNIYVLAGIDIGSILYSILLTAPFAVGASALALSVIRNQKIAFGSIFEGFRCWVSSVGTMVRVFIASILWTVLLSIVPIALLTAAFVQGDPGLSMIKAGSFGDLLGKVIPGSGSLELCNMLFIAAAGASVICFILLCIILLRYQMIYFVLADRNGRMKPKEVVEESRKVIKKHTLKLLGLYLSFIGWYLLAGLALVAIVLLLYILLNELVIGTLSIIVTVVLGIVAFGTALGYVLLMIYMLTSSAVYYSLYSGNFKYDGGPEDDGTDSPEDGTSDISSEDPAGSDPEVLPATFAGTLDAAERAVQDELPLPEDQQTYSGADGVPYASPQNVYDFEPERVSGEYHEYSEPTEEAYDHAGNVPEDEYVEAYIPDSFEAPDEEPDEESQDALRKAVEALSAGSHDDVSGQEDDAYYNASSSEAAQAPSPLFEQSSAHVPPVQQTAAQQTSNSAPEISPVPQAAETPHITEAPGMAEDAHQKETVRLFKGKEGASDVEAEVNTYMFETFEEFDEAAQGTPSPAPVKYSVEPEDDERKDDDDDDHDDHGGSGGGGGDEDEPQTVGKNGVFVSILKDEILKAQVRETLEKADKNMQSAVTSDNDNEFEHLRDVRELLSIKKPSPVM